VPPIAHHGVVKNTSKNRIDPPCLEEALRRVILVISMIFFYKKTDLIPKAASIM
jgi:hypothetical protein